MCLIQNMDNLGWETFYWFHLLWWLNSQMENGEVLPVVNRLPNLLSQAILFVL